MKALQKNIQVLILKPRAFTISICIHVVFLLNVKSYPLVIEEREGVCPQTSFLFLLLLFKEELKYYLTGQAAGSSGEEGGGDGEGS